MRQREGGREDPTLHIQHDRLAELSDSVLNLTPVVSLISLLHRPEHQRSVGVELCLSTRCLDVVEDGRLFPYRKYQ